MLDIAPCDRLHNLQTAVHILTSVLGGMEPKWTQIASKDKDFRYMGTSDMLNELRKDSFQADNETESKLCQVVLTQLDDASGDISALAVSW